MKDKLLIIVNKNAGHGKASLIEKYIDASIIKNNYAVEVAVTEYRNHATELARYAIVNGFNCVVAAGGDGTVNETAKSLVNTDVALGIIPFGSGNGLAKHLNYPSDPVKALNKIAKGNSALIDTLIINGKFAVNVSGLGFDGYVAQLFDQHKKRGLSTYTKIALRNFFSYPSLKFQIIIDGKLMHADAQMLVIANASQFGNSAVIAPKALLNDGLIDIVIIKRPPLHQLPLTFYRLFNGTLRPNNFTQMYQCSSIQINTGKPAHLHIDGEPQHEVCKTDVSINVNSLRVIS
jgi:diacylglycerol kinase (ATP)